MSDEKEQKEEPQITDIRPATIADSQKTFATNEPQQGEPVKVTDDITPITRQPITQVDADSWDKMSLNQLHEQLIALENRLQYAQGIGHIDIVNQLQLGVRQVTAMINKRTPKEIRLI